MSSPTKRFGPRESASSTPRRRTRSRCTTRPDRLCESRPRSSDPPNSSTSVERKESPVELRPIRKGVAEIKAHASVSQEANSRYLDALAVVDEDEIVQEILKDVLAPAKLGKRRVRALRPWSEPDLDLLRTVAHGEFVTTGFRKRDIAALLWPEHEDEASRKCSSARISHLLRLLRAHSIIRKREGTHHHFVTNKGRVVIAAVVAASTPQLSKLKQCA